MDAYLIVLRIFHILAGVFWVGASVFFFLFVEPTAKALGPQAGPFMGHMTQKRKLPAVIVSAAGVTVVAGLLLYWQVSGGLDQAWLKSGPGIGFTIGALSAIGAFVLGLVVIRPNVERMGALAGEIQASGGPPNPAQAAELQRLDTRLKSVGRINIALLTVAVLLMAIARYL
ncbi:MAG TPA: hypothetical protein VHL78_01440 [Actinomycetota bacterium]|nr:hypothetical protein [Actinomycetota bacterium]